MSRVAYSPRHTLSRRTFLGFVGATTAAGLLIACGGSDETASSDPETARNQQGATDYERLFAGSSAADEPNGDLSTVVWPDFVTASPQDVQDLYAFHVTNGELMRYMPCFCGCGAGSGHHNNRDCYIQSVQPDGSVTFDPMAPT